MRRILMALVIGLITSVASLAMAAETAVPLPAPHADLFGLHAAPITVIEPHRSTPLKPVEVTYTGYPVAPVLDALLGMKWRTGEALVGFEAKDGYLSMISAAQLLRYPAYLVYARSDGDDFSVEVPPLNNRVKLGPWYLVWDNVQHASLQADGATYWPYQVEKIGLVSAPSKAKLFPAMLSERYRDGATLTEKYCLSCHQVNGVGGNKMPIDLGQWAANQSFARFATWVLDPSGKNPLTAMPPLAPERPASERQLMARQIYGYLRAIGALGK